MQLGDLVYSLSVLREQKKGLEQLVDAKKKEIAAVEKELIETMKADKVEETAAGDLRVALKLSTYPKVEDWKLFEDFIYDNRRLDLLERRPAVLAYREMLALRRAVPGVIPSDILKLNYRTLNNDD